MNVLLIKLKSVSWKLNSGEPNQKLAIWKSNILTGWKVGRTETIDQAIEKNYLRKLRI